MVLQLAAGSLVGYPRVGFGFVDTGVYCCIVLRPVAQDGRILAPADSVALYNAAPPP